MTLPKGVIAWPPINPNQKPVNKQKVIFAACVAAIETANAKDHNNNYHDVLRVHFIGGHYVDFEAWDLGWSHGVNIHELLIQRRDELTLLIAQAKGE